MSAGNIKVAIKARPLLKKEKENKLLSQWKIHNNSIQNIESQLEPFYFDHIFDQDATNQELFDIVAKPIVDAALKGFNGTIFAYGQTSSGKTYTMLGDDKNPGVMVLAAKEIFKDIESETGREFLLRVGYIEIYNEKIYDLLNKKNQDLKIHESVGGEVTVNCKEFIIRSEAEIMEHLQAGNKIRKISETQMNERSSRSHAIFRIIIESREMNKTADDEGCVQISQLNLVDLAGSERADQTGATGSRLKEGGHINRSLLSLSVVINKLSENESDKYINYRDSKLTRILQASLGGNALTAIICTIKTTALEETSSTLNFALRAKTIKNKPQINEVISDAAMMKRLEKEIARLAVELKIEKSKNSSIKIFQLEKQIREEALKIVHSHSVGSKKTEPRRRTWCPSSIDIVETDEVENDANRKNLIPATPLIFMPSNITMRNMNEIFPSIEENHTLNNEVFHSPSNAIFTNDFKTPERIRKATVTKMSITPVIDVKKQFKHIEREFEELQEFTKLEKNLNVEHDSYAALTEKLNISLKRIAEFEKEQIEFLSYRDELVEKEIKLKNSQQRCLDLEERINSLEMTSKNSPDDVIGSKKLINEKEIYINELQKELSEIRQQFDKKEYEKMKFLNEELKEKLQKVETEQISFKNNVSEKNKLELIELENKLKSSVEEITCLQKDITKLRNTNQNLQDENDTLSNQIMDTIQENDAIKLRCDKIEAIIQVLTENNPELQTVLERELNSSVFDPNTKQLDPLFLQKITDKKFLTNEYNEVCQKLTKINFELFELKNHNDELENQIKSQESVIDDLKIEKDLLNSNSNFLESERQKLIEKIDKFTADIRESNEENRCLKEIIKNIEMKNSEFIEKLNLLSPLKAKNDILSTEVIEARAKLSNLENKHSIEIINLNKEIENLKNIILEMKKAESIVEENWQNNSSNTDNMLDFLASIIVDPIVDETVDNVFKELNLIDTSSSIKDEFNESNKTELDFVNENQILNNLRSEIIELNENKFNLIQKLDKLEDLNLKLDNNLAEDKILISKLEQNLENIKIQQNENLSKLNETQKINENLQQEYLELKTIKIELETIINELKMKIEILENSNNELILCEENLKIILDTKNTDNMILREKLAKLEIINEKLMKRLKDIETQNEDLEQVIVKNSALMEQTENECQSLKLSTAKFLETVYQLEEEKDQLIRQLSNTSFNDQINILNTQLTNVRSEKLLLEDQIENLQAEKKDLCSEKLLLDKQIENFQTETKDFHSLMHEKEEYCNQLLDEIKLLKVQIENYKIIKENDEKLKEMTTKCEKLAKKCSDLENKLNDFNSESKFKEIQEFEMEKIRLKQENDEISKKLTELEGKCGETISYLESKISQIQQLETANLILNQENNEIKKQLDKFELDLKVSNSSLDLKIQEIHEYEKEKVLLNEEKDVISKKLGQLECKYDETISDLESKVLQIKELETFKQVLNKENNEIKKQLHKFELELEVSNSSLHSNIEQIKEFEKERILLIQEKDDISKKLKELECKYDQTISNIDSEVAQTKQLETANLILNKENNEIKNQLHKLELELKVCNSTLNSKIEQIQGFEKEQILLNEQKLEISKKLADLECKYAETISDLESKVLQTKELEASKLILNKENNEFKQQLYKMELQLEISNSNLDAKIEKIQEFEKEKILLIQEKHEILKKLAELECKYGETISNIDSEVAQIKEFEMKKNALSTKQFCELEVKFKQSNLDLTLKNIRIKELEQEINVMSSKIQELDDALKKSNSRLDSKNLCITEIEKEKNILANEKYEALKLVVELEFKLKQSNSSLDSIKSLIQELENEKTVIIKENDKITKHLHDLELKLKESSSSFDSKSLEIQQLTNEKDELSQRLSEIEKMHVSKIRQLQSEINELKILNDKTKNEISKTHSILNIKIFEIQEITEKYKNLQDEFTTLKLQKSQNHGDGKQLTKRRSADVEELKRQHMIEKLINENDELKMKNQTLFLELDDSRQLQRKDRKARRQSTHDEKRQSLWDNNRDVATMTLPTDNSCNCQELDKKVSDLKMKLTIKDCQINTMLLESKSNPLKDENETLKKLLAAEELEKKKLKLDLQKLKQRIIDLHKITTVCRKCTQKSVTHQCSQTDAENKENEMNFGSSFISKIEYTKMSEAYTKLQTKFEDCKKICIFRYEQIKTLEMKLNEFNKIMKVELNSNGNSSQSEIFDQTKKEIFILKKKYEEAKYVLELRAKRIYSLEERLAKYEAPSKLPNT